MLLLSGLVIRVMKIVTLPFRLLTPLLLKKMPILLRLTVPLMMKMRNVRRRPVFPVLVKPFLILTNPLKKFPVRTVLGVPPVVGD